VVVQHVLLMLVHMHPVERMLVLLLHAEWLDALLMLVVLLHVQWMFVLLMPVQWM
jgi:hypothetical protein